MARDLADEHRQPPGAAYALRDATGQPREAAPVSWWRPEVDRAAIRALMQKDDRIATRDAALWLGLLLGTGALAALLWPSWWSAPLWLAYGVLYCSASDARWHECGHRTAFATGWKNEVIYQIASFLLIRSSVVWRASHVRHHTDTIVVGRDPEIQAMRPPDLVRLGLNIFGLMDVKTLVPRFLLHASGRLHPEEETYVRGAERAEVFRTARIWAAIYITVGAAALFWQNWLPLMLVGGPRIYGAWHMWMTGVLQHLGMAENVTDHRLNTRTVLMNPVSRFLYLNMNYHLEHHMFTMVPYYHLPKLHALIQGQVPRPEPSIGAAFRRMIPVLWRQLREEKAVIVYDLPEGAPPYRPEVEVLRPHAVTG